MYKLLSYPLNINAPHPPAIPDSTLSEFLNVKNDGASVHKLTVYSHTGTHLDTSAHVFEKGEYITDFSVKELIFDNIAIIEMSLPDNTVITEAQLTPYTEKISKSDFLIFNFNLADHRKNQAERFIKNSPGFSIEAGKFLAKFKMLKGIGVDAPSVASINKIDETMAVHNELLAMNNGKFIIVEELKLDRNEKIPKKITIVPWFVDGMHSGPCTVIAEYDELDACDEEYLIRKSILDACHWITEKKLVYSTWGNISVRYKNGLILTPSKLDYNVMTTDDMVELDFDGKIVKGNRVPTSEREIHRLILKNRLDIGAVVHTHSPYACAAAAAGLELPCLIEEIPQLLGGSVECTPYYITGGNHLPLAELTLKTLGDKKFAVLIRNHGPVVCGRTLDEALYGCLVLEKAAMMTLLLKNKIDFVPIPEELANEERYRFIYKYGKE